jgi:long-chain acyl-CoA synthetase
MSFSTIPEAFLKTCSRYGDTKAAFRFNDKEGKIQSISYAELQKRVEYFAIGLMDFGLRPKDRIGIISENRIEWIIADLAIATIGAISVPIFPTLTPKQIEFTYNDCSASAIILSNNFQLKKVLEVQDNIASLRQIIVMNDEFSPQEIQIKTMKSIIEAGQKSCEKQNCSKILQSTISKISTDDLLTLIYTSGTTGNPKGVMLTHRNILANYEGIRENYDLHDKDISVSYLPLSHSYERTTGYYTLFFIGLTIGLAESIDGLVNFIQEIKPTVMTTVPRFLETIKKKVNSNMAKESSIKQGIFKQAMEVGKKLIYKRQEGKSPLLLEMQYKLYDKLVYHKIRERLGGQLRLLVSGGAALSDDVYEFFTTVGITTVQGYGLTESAPVVSANRQDKIEIGTIGKPLFNVQVRFAEDGEILVKGDNVMKGYWGDEEATRMAIDEDGWLYTGDVGILTKLGNIKITDRKKNIFVSSGGKNIAPQPIENLLSQSKFIDHVILIGEKREYCTALITPNYEQLESLAKEFDIKYDSPSELTGNPKIVNHLKKEIDYYQKDLAKYEKVRKFAMLSEPFTIENGELSPKLSIKRHVVEKKYAEIISQLYNENN